MGFCRGLLNRGCRKAWRSYLPGSAKQRDYIMFVDFGDTWQLGIGWLNKKDYGEGGFFIMIGKMYINFWKKPEYM